MPAPDPFEAQRAYLTRLAYQLLGSVNDAEDMVQETFLRWEGAGRPSLREPRAWFTTTCTRLCLDRLKSAQRERDRYVGEWFPEPLLEEGPSAGVLDESVSIALLATIEKLRPAERASFLLHDVFGYTFGQVAEILALEPANCRQLAVRARERLHGGTRPRATVSAKRIEALSDAFFRAIRDGDVAALEATLSEDVRFASDGGGKAPAALKPILGREAVRDFIVAVLVPNQREFPPTLRRVHFNGAPGTVLFVEGRPVSAFQFELDGDRIAGIWVHRNPEKLSRFATE